MPGDRLVYTVPEAAAVLGVSEFLVRKQAKAGLIPHQRIGQRLLFPKKALDAWVTEQAAKSLKDGAA